MKKYQLYPIGTISVSMENTAVMLEKKYIPALKELENFSYIQVLYWFHHLDNDEARNILETAKPYQKGPDVMGTFATRSPARPNPIALSAAKIIGIDAASGIIYLEYIDAEDGSPVLDIKPYTPSSDRIEYPKVPDWCAHWPKNYEASGDFQWDKEFHN